jgi:photosystem II stability/assembly factor-like uncharacterized protein
MTRTTSFTFSLTLAFGQTLATCRAEAPQESKGSRSVVSSSSDDGATWVPKSTGLPEDAQASFFARQGDELLLATDNRGLFRTTNKRMRWEPLGRQLAAAKITALHAHSDEVLVGVYQRGIHRSEDGGEKWSALNEGLPNLNVRAIVRCKANLFVGTNTGIYKKQDGAGTWEECFVGAQISSLNEQDGKIVAGTTAGVLLCEDDGDTWTTIHNAGALHNCSIVDGRIIAMYISDDVFVSDDWGATWTEANYMPRERSYIYEATTGRNSLLMSNNYGIFQSTDDGRNWQHVFKAGPDVFFFDFIVVDKKIYGGTRGASR